MTNIEEAAGVASDCAKVAADVHDLFGYLRARLELAARVVATLHTAEDRGPPPLTPEAAAGLVTALRQVHAALAQLGEEAARAVDPVRPLLDALGRDMARA